MRFGTFLSRRSPVFSFSSCNCIMLLALRVSGRKCSGLPRRSITRGYMRCVLKNAFNRCASLRTSTHWFAYSFHMSHSESRRSFSLIVERLNTRSPAIEPTMRATVSS
uniref:Putative secreted protein n=1 Tax=Anopheles marajoara TaxID=58244 RepID=A0A2M4C940_9DIPT